MVCAGVPNGRVFRQVGENSLYDIRVFNTGHRTRRAGGAVFDYLFSPE